MKTFSLLFSACMLFTSIIHGQSNEGTAFWFGFMEHVDDGNNNMVVMISSKQTTSGKISAPALGLSKEFSVIPEEVTLINLPPKAEIRGSESIQNKGIILESLEPVSVFIHQYANLRSEASLVLPINSLGKSYYVMSYPGIQYNNSAPTYSEFLIIATEDDTDVTITLSTDTQKGRSKGQTYSISMNRGQCYQVQAKSTTGDLTGTYILADKRISVIGGSEWSQVPSGCTFMDNLMEQMYPIETWGNKYITVPNVNVNSDLFRLLASEDDTEVTVRSSSTSTSYQLNKGEFVEYTIKRETTEINSNNPVLLAQYNIGSSCSGYPYGDPSMLLINPVAQSRDSVTLYNSSFQNIFENYITSIIKTDDISISTFDGLPITQEAFVSGTSPDGDYSYFTHKVNPGAHTIISPGCGVIASSYGYGDKESYSYGGGANFRNFNESPLPDGGCLNDTVFFDSGLSPFRYDVEWDFGDGDIAFGSEVTHIYTELGTYTATIKYTDKCLDTKGKNEKDLFISLRDKVDLPDSVIICEYETLAISATDIAEATYEWKGPNKQHVDYNQEMIIDSIREVNSGAYQVVGIVSGCATFPAFMEVKVLKAPVPMMDDRLTFCNRQNTVDLSPGIFASYQWSTGEDIPTITIAEEGIYSVTVTDEQLCQGENFTIVDNICPSEIYIANIFSPNGDGINDYFKIETFQIITYKIIIYDRWGNVIFKGNEKEEQWDGSHNGQPVRTGVYTYYIEYRGMDVLGMEDTFTLIGDVTVIK